MKFAELLPRGEVASARRSEVNKSAPTLPRVRMRLDSFRHKIVRLVKRLIFGKRGETIQYGPHTLRYVVGSRPVRLKYASSNNTVVRNDAQQIQFYLDRVASGNVVLDVGSHYGEYAVLFGALVGARGKVVCFEPDLAALSVLRANIALNGFQDRIVVEERGVFDFNESKQLYARHGNAQSSLARTGLGGSDSDDDVERYSVETIRLDDFILQSGLKPPSYIKLDVEGAEINALRGAKHTLLSPAVIVCELHPYAWSEFGTSFDELLAIVRNSGRSIAYLDGSRRIEDGAAYGAVLIS
jgi:FkbM family methyltransferase